MTREDVNKFTYGTLLTAVLLLMVNMYWFLHPFWRDLGLTSGLVDKVYLRMVQGGVLQTPLKSKVYIVILVTVSFLLKPAMKVETPVRVLVATGLSGLLLFFYPFTGLLSYGLSTMVGLVLISWTIPRLVGKGKKYDFTDDKETFEQNEELMETPDSINIPIRYQYRHRIRQGWVNIVNPYRATMITGGPGAGKTYSVIDPFIEQMTAKGFSMFVYDYKFPSLTMKVWNELLDNVDAYEARPEFCVIDMNHPEYSLRCNPLHPRYIKDPTDATEVADIIFKNLNKGEEKKSGDFFSQSAVVLLESVIWFLREYEGGRYCTFPHAIEFISQPYKDFIKILLRYPEIQARMRPFENAMNGDAPEQLQGQMASAQIPLAKFVSKSLYWILTGDDIPLDINSKERPVIFCVGNDPDRQMIYGTCIALITSRMFKSINRPGRNRCGVLLDEFPTVYLKGIDHLVNTCRSNRVAVVIGAQDKSQIVKDYGEQESEVVFNTVGNYFSGQVNGKTAQDYSQSFGRRLEERHGYTYSVGSDSVNVTSQEAELMPQRKVETFSQGEFFGRMADENDMKIDRKLFCGEIIRPKAELKEKKKHWVPLPRMTSFGAEPVVEKLLSSGDEGVKKILLRNLRLQGIHYDPDSEKMLLELKCLTMTSKAKRKMVEKEARRLEAAYMDRVLQENFDRIQREVQEIIHKERQRTDIVKRRDQDLRAMDPFDGV